MRKLTGISRRLFGQSLGATMALTFLPTPIFAQTKPKEIMIRKFAFEPKTLTIQLGASVRWTNEDSAPHTATSVDQSWDTGGLEKHQTGMITFQKTGTYPYFCLYHPHMKGEIIVVG